MKTILIVLAFGLNLVMSASAQTSADIAGTYTGQITGQSGSPLYLSLQLVSTSTFSNSGQLVEGIIGALQAYDPPTRRVTVTLAIFNQVSYDSARGRLQMWSSGGPTCGPNNSGGNNIGLDLQINNQTLNGEYMAPALATPVNFQKTN